MNTFLIVLLVGVTKGCLIYAYETITGREFLPARKPRQRRQPERLSVAPPVLLLTSQSGSQAD